MEDDPGIRWGTGRSDVIRPVAAAMVALPFLLMGAGALVGAGTGTPPPSPPSSRTVRTAPPSGPVTLSWQIRSAAPDVRLRLYRIDREAAPVLLAERRAGPGETSFRYVDGNRPPLQTTYEIRYVGRLDKEITLGVVVCVPGSLVPTDAATQTVSLDPAVMPPASGQTVPTALMLAPPSPTFPVGMVVGPDPPVPRAA